MSPFFRVSTLCIYMYSVMASQYARGVMNGVMLEQMTALVAVMTSQSRPDVCRCLRWMQWHVGHSRRLTRSRSRPLATS